MDDRISPIDLAVLKNARRLGSHVGSAAAGDVAVDLINAVIDRRFSAPWSIEADGWALLPEEG